MCGISIAINLTNATVSESLISAMNERILHRGPDDGGFYFGANFALGHRRLSILDLSSAGHQPMQRGNLWITYNGEVYNYIELRGELEGLGHSFVSATDTEVILAAYAQWGKDSFQKLNGMWSFAIYDEQANEIVLCRDHFGIKPMNFALIGDHFVAGSEIKQFLDVPGFKPLLNRKVAANFLAHGYLNYSDKTFFEGVNELRPGHYLTYNLSSHKTDNVQWYDLGKASKPVHDDYETAVKTTRALFLDSTRIRMRSDVRVGSCLSGGIDSSSIVTVIQSQNMANKDFATITSCYEDRKFDEQEFSDLVSQQTGFQALKVFPDLDHLWTEGHLDKMLYHQDQPIASASHYSEFKVFEKAREAGMIVMQDGQGSDEYLCGYGEFFIASVKEDLSRLKLASVSKTLREKSKHRNRSFGCELKSFLNTSYVHHLQKKVKSVIGKSDFPWFSPEWRSIATGALVNFNSDRVRELSIMEIQHSSIPYQLHSEDRNSMTFSIESRLPFLDHRLVEYIIGLPTAFKIRRGFTKAVLRDAVTELPDRIKHRTDKMGFVAPDISWIRENKDQVRTDLVDLVEQFPIFSNELIRRFDQFIEGNLGYESIYFRAMAFKRFISLYKIEI